MVMELRLYVRLVCRIRACTGFDGDVEVLEAIRRSPHLR